MRISTLTQDLGGLAPHEVDPGLWEVAVGGTVALVTSTAIHCRHLMHLARCQDRCEEIRLTQECGINIPMTAWAVHEVGAEVVIQRVDTGEAGPMGQEEVVLIITAEVRQWVLLLGLELV